MMPKAMPNIHVPMTPPTGQTEKNYQKTDESKTNSQKHDSKSNLIHSNPDSEDDPSLSKILSDAQLAASESFSDTSVSCNGLEPLKKDIEIKPLVLKSFVDEPKCLGTLKAEKVTSSAKEITVDNSVSVEVALEKSPKSTKPKGNNVSTTVVTEETTVTKENGNSKVVTVTSITTSLSHGGIKDLLKQSPDKNNVDELANEKEKTSTNDLNIETLKGSRIIDCSSSCNIVTEVK
ncbi:storkhead-box protein 1 [Caerostris darwini]|uniref:Storkhead-box protein 1 n=1 Tax=Caerostris darwini TaxID=1538125 RepID=A0AAV4N252_9ARAC|nr:storkhead-box protein 1 [Caerostris darwini]